MDLTIRDGDALVLYVEHKTRLADVKKLLPAFIEYGRSGFDLDDPDKGNDPLRKAKYLVRTGFASAVFRNQRRRLPSTIFSQIRGRKHIRCPRGFAPIQRRRGRTQQHQKLCCTGCSLGPPHLIQSVAAESGYPLGRARLRSTFISRIRPAMSF